MLRRYFRSSSVLRAPPREMGGRSRGAKRATSSEFSALQDEVSNLTGGMDTSEREEEAYPKEGFQIKKKFTRDADSGAFEDGGDAPARNKEKYPREFGAEDEEGGGFSRRPKYEDRKPFDKDSRGGGGFEKKPWQKDGGGFDKKPWQKDGGERSFEKKPWQKEGGGFDKKPWQKEGGGFDKKPWQKDGGEKPSFEKKPWGDKDGGERKPWGDRDGGERKPWGDKDRGERKPWGDKDGGERKPWGDKDGGERKPWGDKDGGERKPWGDKDGGNRGDQKPFEERKPFEESGARKSSKPPAFRPEPRPPRPATSPSTTLLSGEDESQFSKLLYTSTNHEFIYGRVAVMAALTYMEDEVLRTSTRLICASTVEDTLDLLKLARDKQVPIEKSSRMRMGDVVGSNAARVHDDIIMEIPKLEYVTIKKETVVRTPKLEGEEKAPVTLMLALDEIVDPTNLASILRSAHYFGVYTVLASEKNSAPLSPLVTHASKGASIVLSETHRLLGTKNLAFAIGAHKREGWRVIGTSASAQGERIVSIDSLDLENNPKTILVMGSERSGLRQVIKDQCDYFVHLNRPERPTPQAKPSSHSAAATTPGTASAETNIALNVSAATSALLAQLLK